MITMKKWLLTICTVLVAASAMAQMKKIIETKPSGSNLKLVQDYTGTLSTAEIDVLDRKLYQFDDSTSNQIAVVIVPSTDEYSIEDAAIALGRSWGVGNKEFNNGVVVLIAKDDRKMTIQVGYGLEGAITDLASKSIIDNYFTPRFKENKYYQGIDEGTDQLINAAQGRYKAPANYAKRKKKDGGPGSIIITLFIIVIILASISGGGGGTYVSSGGFGGWGGGGGRSSGGGGGFGGFGGGSFGGGGSSGSW